MTNLRSPRHTKSLQHNTQPEYRAAFTCSLLFVMIVAMLSFGFMRTPIALAGPSLQENGGDPGTPISDPGSDPASEPGTQPSNSVENFSGSDNILLPDNPIAIDEIASETVGDSTTPNGDAPRVESVPQTESPNADAIIRITNEGFDISQKTIKRGEQVIWLNTGTKSVTIQQNPLFRSFLPVVLSQSAVGELDAAGNSTIPVADQAIQLAENIEQPMSSLGSDALGFTLQPGEQHTQLFDNPGGFLFMLDSNKTPCVINVEDGSQPLPTATATNTEVPPTNTPPAGGETATATSTAPAGLATRTPTSTATRTPTRTPINTATATETGTPIDTATNTPTPPNTATATHTGTTTPTRTPTASPTATDTTAPTSTATQMVEPTPEAAATTIPPEFSAEQLVVALPTSINQDMSLTADTTYLVSGVVTITVGTRITVEAGAVVKFNTLEFSAVRSKLVVNGVLKVRGTPNNMAIFTSINDDRYGGDSMRDGVSRWPEAGDWEAIEVRGPQSSADIQYALITFGGDGSTGASLSNNGSNLSLIGTEIIYSKSNGALWLSNAHGQMLGNVINRNLSNGIELRTSSNPLIQNNTIVHNRKNAIQHEGNSFPSISSNTVYGNGINGIGVTGSIGSGNWNVNANLPYVALETVTIETGNALTLPIGTVMKFMPRTTLVVRGALIARGMPGLPIVFTSLKDDAYGGDTQQDGAATKPTPGDWGSVYFADTSNDGQGWLENVLMRFGGAGYTYGPGGTTFANLSLDSASPKIESSIFERSKQYGVQFLNVSLSLFQNNTIQDNASHGHWISQSSAPQVLNNLYQRNGGFAIYVIGSSPAFFDGNIAKGNKINGIGINNILNADTYWEYDLPYVFDGVVTIDYNTTLEIQPGAVLKFMLGSKVVVNGNLKAEGSGEQPILFTSIKDDSYAGDTNGDNAKSAPAPGDWESINFEPTAGGSILRYATLRYGGSNQNTGAVYVKDSEPTIQYLTVLASKYRGLYAQAAIGLVLTDAVFAHNAIGVYNDNQASLIIHHSNLYSNTQYGLYNNNSGFVVDATGNWWGHDTGPNQPNGIAGAGDAIFGAANAANFLLAPAVPPADRLPDFPSEPVYTQVSGTVSINTVWQLARSPYLVTDNVTVNSGASLTIEPGVVLKFAVGKNLHINGTLVAAGTPLQRIIFTSFKDDTVGGDTNNDKTGSWPTLGDWGRIYFSDSTNDLATQLRYTEIRYAGAVTNTNIISTAIYIESADPVVEENRIVQNAGYGVFFRNQAKPKIRNNWILDNSLGGVRCDVNSGGNIENNELWGNGGYAVYMDGSCFPVIDGNVSHYNENNGVRVGGNIKFNQVWRPNLTYVVDGLVTVENGPTLTVQSGVVVKFKDPSSVLRLEGNMVAVSAPNAQVVFTSLHDDAYGGDTNNDDGSYWPTRGDWGQIHFADSTNDGVSRLQEVLVQYGGSPYATFGQYNIYLQSNGTELSNNTIQHSSGYGLAINNQADPLVQENIITRNRSGGVTITDHSNPTMISNYLWGNWGFAVEMTADCKPRYIENTVLENRYDAIKVTGVVESDTVWDVNIHYAPGNVTINGGAKLTLGVNTYLKFLPNATWHIYGTLEAPGTAEIPIIFTSIKDDEHGGDTNLDGDVSMFTEEERASTRVNGNLSPPNNGDWATLNFYNQTGLSILDYDQIYYGGDPVIKVHSGTLNVSNLLFAHNRTGLFYNGSDGEVYNTYFYSNTLHGIKEVNSSLWVYDSIFIENRRGIYIESPSFAHPPLNTNNFIHNWEYSVWTDGEGFNLIDPTNQFDNQIGNSLWVDNGVIEEETTLYSGRVYRFDNVTFGTFDIPIILAIEPDVVVKFAKSTSLMTVVGALYANGDESDAVIFTSYKDDSWGGDTNNDGNATQPAPGDWSSIVLSEDLFPDNHTEAVFNFTKVLYGSSSSFSGAIKGSRSVSLSMYDSEVAYAEGSGIYINNTTGGYWPVVLIERTMIAYNGKNGIFMKGGAGNLTTIPRDVNEISVQSSVIHDNREEGIIVNRTYDFDSNNLAFINFCDIYQNQLNNIPGIRYGVKNDSSVVPVDATSNYWGHENGPYPYNQETYQNANVGDGVNNTNSTIRIEVDPFNDVPNDPIIAGSLTNEEQDLAGLPQKVYLPMIAK